MSELIETDAGGPRFIHVDAKPDHLASLARGKPVSALAELVWNALDADADRVRIGVTDNDLGNPVSIEVVDNGLGITFEDAERTFGSLGGSWKREHRVTARSNKKMHGRNGKGRFKAFALGHEVVWDSVYLGNNDTPLHFVISGRSDRLQDFEIGKVRSAPMSRSRGTRVRIDSLPEPFGVLSSDGSANRQLAETFALYLRNYPATEIIYRGERIDPASVQKSHETVRLPAFIAADGSEITAVLDIVEWSFSKKERRICLCDSEGFALHEVEAGVRPGTEFNFTAYIRSDYIAKLNHDNGLALDELDPDLRRLAESARGALRSHFRRRKAEAASELVQQWKDEGVYPFTGDAAGSLETARREVFDICALNVHQYLDSFREGRPKDRQFTLRMLKAALDENPESLKRILSDVLELPKEKQTELADLLQYTTLSSIIEASKMVADRLQFLTGFQELLFRPDTKKSLRERTQLHRMLENETWLFGEEYLLTSSDENLNTVLRKHLAKLRPPEKGTRRRAAPVVRDDGTQAVIDLLLAREVPAYAQTRREFLVVELKRPSQKIDLEVASQIQSYALTVASDERFDVRNTHWTFIAISNEMSPEAARTVRQQGKPYGFFHQEDNLRIGLATWAEVIAASRARLEAFRSRLDYTATTDQGVALLHSKYARYLPESFLPQQVDPSTA
ncbi:histidine kinase/DNA gyrase B/HSP90-like ATPase [Paraburkholderia sp. BL6669N2]|uniref:ATP-binding protein n=1 Tax=Paraburkholderia sp. BL6669N2 TaxID=1938807 RepID=UPI000E36F23A|nr:ATP-binding protein [Paraburkholderia sp. BL6669N2]REG49096.1 histidine kinase/DNA gyrase B/HSP90-like ATPase [Paraburkholderia sp. BL6669N2]